MIFDRVKSLDHISHDANAGALKRQLTAFDLTILGVGAVIGTGIFILTSVAAQKAGPAMMFSFVIAAAICGLTALVYAEIASMVPVSGSAYTYAYTVLGELIAWMVGWALILEYIVSASTVAVGWSGYINGVLAQHGMALPAALAVGGFAEVASITGSRTPGAFNLLAFGISLLVTWLLVIGTSKSAKVTAVMVLIKVVALVLFIVLAVPKVQTSHFHPLLPNGWTGVSAAAASIFFAYVGFDAVSTAAEETQNPRRSIPIGVLCSLLICTVIYVLVAYAAAGAVGAQPGGDLAQSSEPLAFVLRAIQYSTFGDFIAAAASISLPSVVLMMIFGQTRILFAMSRDGLLPAKLSRVHPKYHTPHVATWITGVLVAIFASQFRVDMLADISNAGTLFAFAAVACGVLVLRITAADRERPFRAPMIWLVAPLAILGCVYLFYSLNSVVPIGTGVSTQAFFGFWTLLGLGVYFTYSRRRSTFTDVQ